MRGHDAAMLAAVVGFGVAAVVARWSIPRMSVLAAAFGSVAEPSPRGVHTASVPLSGGPSVLFGVAVALVVTGVHAPLWILATAPAMAAIGLVDDVVELRWTHKLGLQIAVCVLALWLAGHSVANMHGLARLGWLVLVTNAINVIDNMDGLATGTSMLALGSLALVGARSGSPAACYFALVVAGGALGFFGENFVRGAAFLGDCGALALGFIAGAISMTIADDGGNLVACALPLAYPLVDVAFVVVTRSRRGVHPAAGGTDHTSHRLADRLADRRRAVAVLLGLSLVSGAAACVLA